MTTAEFLTFLIMPVGGLLIGAVMLFVTRKDRAANRSHKPSH